MSMLHLRSFPTRERGLKFPNNAQVTGLDAVVPHAGTWIEIYARLICIMYDKVVPHAGTWIEIFLELLETFPVKGRSPRGNVD